MLECWIGFGSLLVSAGFLLPGLVAVFVGMGALTVAGLMYFEVLETTGSQIMVWFASSTVYLFSLRLLVMKLYPGDTEKQNVDEDAEMVGKVVLVTAPITETEPGRVAYSDSTWQARSKSGEPIEPGEKVGII